MPSLIILGNTNPTTFANAIIAANIKSKELFGGRGVDKVFIIHTLESRKVLWEKREWVNHIESESVNTSEISEKLLDIDNSERSVHDFVAHIEFIMNGLQERKDEVIVDLTNGPTFNKNLLAIVCYLLDIKHQYVIDITLLSSKTDNRGFLTANILMGVYIASPDSKVLDSIAYLELAEVIRYKIKADKQTRLFKNKLTEVADAAFFYDNLISSIDIKFKADERQNNSLYRIATGSIAASIEEMVHHLHLKHLGNPGRSATLGTKIFNIQNRIKSASLPGFDREFLNIFNRMILYLRNNTIHKTGDLNDLEGFKAVLMLNMAFPFIDFYLSFVDQALSLGQPKMKKVQILEPDNKSNKREKWFIGLDGDNTGQALEKLFEQGEEIYRFKEFSEDVKASINRVIAFLKANKLEHDIIFNAGDDLLFSAVISESDIYKLKDIYINPEKDLTCSIGYGKTIYDVYIAMNMAKSKAGKNTIVGVSVSE